MFDRGYADGVCRLGSLNVFLSEVTGVEPDSIISFLSDGQQIRNENLAELGGKQDQVCVQSMWDAYAAGLIQTSQFMCSTASSCIWMQTWTKRCESLH